MWWDLQSYWFDATGAWNQAPESFSDMWGTEQTTSIQIFIFLGGISTLIISFDQPGFSKNLP